jgi:hypothetical protein
MFMGEPWPTKSTGIRAEFEAIKLLSPLQLGLRRQVNLSPRRQFHRNAFPKPKAARKLQKRL